MAASARSQFIESAAMLNLQEQQKNRLPSTPCKNSNLSSSMMSTDSHTPFKVVNINLIVSIPCLQVFSPYIALFAIVCYLVVFSSCALLPYRQFSMFDNFLSLVRALHWNKWSSFYLIY